MVQPPFFPVHMADFRGELRFHDLDGARRRSARRHQGQGPHRPPHRPHPRLPPRGRRASVAYLPDHQAPRRPAHGRPGVLELCDGADLLIHDAQYTEDEFVELSDWGHSTPAYAVHVAAEAGAGGWTCSTTTRPTPTGRSTPCCSRARQVAQAAGEVEVNAARRGTFELRKRDRGRR